jgi:hypothetical protein
MIDCINISILYVFHLSKIEDLVIRSTIVPIEVEYLIQSL